MPMREKKRPGRWRLPDRVRGQGRGHAASPTPHGGMRPHDGRGRGGHRLGRPRLDPRSTRLRLGRFPGTIGRGRVTKPNGGTSQATCAPLKSPCGVSVTSSRSSGSACRKTHRSPAPPGPPRISSWAHAALTDLGTGRHRFSELVVRAAPLLAGFGRHPDTRLAWSVGPPGTPEPWELRWNGDGFDLTMGDAGKSFSFSLSTRPLKPVVFQGPGGLSRKGEGATEASHYYSFTRMATTGTVRLEGKELEVSGVSWMDKEFGSNQLGKDTSGWDWFSLQLDDGREVMLYLLRSRDGKTDHVGATLVDAAGEVRYLVPGDWELNATEEWTSPKTGAAYPAGWTLRIPAAGIAAVITPKLADQENRSALIPNLYYWEGSVRIESESGERIGRGYVELTGYGGNSRPPI